MKLLQLWLLLTNSTQTKTNITPYYVIERSIWLGLGWIGAEVGELATNTILDAGESTLTKFVEQGGVVTTLSGAEKAKFDAMMTEKVMPGMADMFDKEVLMAAEAYAKK